MDRTLYIRITGKCNLQCSFCRASEYMQYEDRGIAGFELALDSAALYKPIVEEVIWSGGEPLLALKRWRQAREILLKKYPDVTEFLVTNGMYIKKDLFKDLRQMKYVEVSIDSYSKALGPRSFEQLLENGCYDLFEYFSEAGQQVSVVSVLTKDRINNYNWADDFIKLYSKLTKTGVRNFALTIDEQYPGPMSTDALVNLVFGFEKLERWVNEQTAVTGVEHTCYVKKFFNQVCTGCDNYVTLEIDGSITKEVPTENIGATGCNELASVIGVEAYNYLNRYFEAKRVLANENRNSANQ